MSLSRRTFVRTLGVGSAGLSAAWLVNGRSLFTLRAAGFDPMLLPADARPILLHNNENPLGPGQAALEAMRAAMHGGGAVGGRYPFDRIRDLRAAIAKTFNVSAENVICGCGSTQLLRTGVQVFTSPTAPLVGGIPSYEECTGYAELIGTPVRSVPLDSQMRLDLSGMAKVAKGAGMIFVNNPNNPTATVHSGAAIADFIKEVNRLSPETTLLVDEAYHDYVTDPSYRSQVAEAVRNPRVVVARTFSKAHGMAGLRLGFAIGHPETIKKMASWESDGNINVLGVTAAMASLQDPARIDAEAKRNTEARAFTVDWFAQRGSKSTDSHANFIFTDVRRPVKEFREACAQHRIIVGRDFPPFEKSHCRISIGTMEEMQRAVEVFGKVLGGTTTTASKRVA